MAQNQTKNETMWVDKRLAAVQYGSAAANQHSGTTSANLKDIAAARARLTAISSTTYTATVLDKMTLNDMWYAIRLNDEAAGI